MSSQRPRAVFFLARAGLGVGVCSGILAVIGAVVTALSGDPVSREVGPGSGGASVTVLEPGTGLVVVDALPTVLLGLAVMVVAWQLLVVVVDVQRGMPFEAGTARRLRSSAAIVVVAALAHPTVSAWADRAVLDAADRSGRDFADLVLPGLLQQSAPWLFAAAVLAAFGHAFAEGRRLTEEIESMA